MFEHIVLFKRKPETTEAQEKEMVRRLLAMREEIPEIVDMSAGLNVSDRSKGYTSGLVVRFERPEDLDVYRPHRAHQEVLAYISEIVDEVLSVDYSF